MMHIQLTPEQRAFDYAIRFKSVFHIRCSIELYPTRTLFDVNEHHFCYLIWRDHKLARLALEKRIKENNPINKEALLNCLYFPENGGYPGLFEPLFRLENLDSKIRLLIDIVGIDFMNDFDHQIKSKNAETNALIQYTLQTEFYIFGNVKRNNHHFDMHSD
jgi:hypothetical protein